MTLIVIPLMVECLQSI